MMDWAHGLGGHFGGHPVPGLHHMNLGGTIVKNGSVKVLVLISGLVIITRMD